MRIKKQQNMTGRVLFTLFIILFSVFIGTGNMLATDYSAELLKTKQSIKSSMLMSHIDFLASWYCRGRATGDIGMEVADQYITSVLSGIGITPAGEYGGFFQNVKVITRTLDKTIRLELADTTTGINSLSRARLDWDFLPVSLSAETAVTAPIIFAGYGITAPEHHYDDYNNINAAGKIVLVMRHEPGEKLESSPFDGTKISAHGTLLQKILNAQKHGAVGIIFVTDPLNHENTAVKGGSWMSGTYWPLLSEESMKDREDFKFMEFSPQMRLAEMDFGIKIPVVLVDGKWAARILGENHSLVQIQEQIDKTNRPNSFVLAGKKITMDIFFKTEPVIAHNIVAKLEGSDPELKNEVIIIGAHYDHIGKDKRGQVNGGADDNASGTSVVIEMARAFKNLPVAPKRTILFILFTGEEEGLLGSWYYTLHPIYPNAKTIAMFNLDMVGRNDVSQVSLMGKYQYPKLFQVVEAANKKSVNFEMNFNSEGSLANSDQFFFMRTGIPSIYLNSGSHDDYHSPRDTVDRVVPQKVEKIAHLLFLSVWDVANLPAQTSFK